MFCVIQRHEKKISKLQFERINFSKLAEINHETAKIHLQEIWST